jgi:choloylglycine hydrolase
MVDIDYLLPASLREAAATLTEVPVEERAFLLDAPAWPFDGMNEQGLVVGMAAVLDSRVPYDPTKASIGSLEVIRQMLDHAQNVDEAIDILDRYNIDMDGVPIHYLIADRSGRSVLVEFYDEMVVIPSVFPWQLATNHLRVNVPAGAPSGCWRYDRIEQRMTAGGGDLTSQQASDLLQSVSQSGEYPTQWSIVYGIESGQIRIVMGRNFDDPVYFQFDLIE